MWIVTMTMEELRGPINTEDGLSAIASFNLWHKQYLGSFLNSLTPRSNLSPYCQPYNSYDVSSEN